MIILRGIEIGIADKQLFYTFNVFAFEVIA